MSIRLIEKTEAGAALERSEAEALMEELLAGRLATPAIVRLLTALNAWPYRAVELAAFARVMRRHAARVFAEGETPPANMVDTCGTGGDGAQTFNISTASAIVAAAAGVRVAKHGNRAASSLSGSADVLEALGVGIDLPFLETGKAIRDWNWVFVRAGGAYGHAACNASAEANQSAHCFQFAWAANESRGSAIAGAGSLLARCFGSGCGNAP